MRLSGYFRVALMLGVLVFLIIYGKRFSDNFAKKFVSFTNSPPDGGVAAQSPPTDARLASYRFPDGGAVSVDEMARLLAFDAGSPPERRVFDSLKRAPSDDIFITRVRALTTVTVSKPEHRKVVGLQLAALLDTPLSPARLRAVLDALHFLSGKELPPRASIWRNYWASIDGGIHPERDSLPATGRQRIVKP